MKRIDYQFGRQNKVFATLSVYQDVGASRLGDHGWISECGDMVCDLNASLQAMYGEVGLLHRLEVDEPEIPICEI